MTQIESDPKNFNFLITLPVNIFPIKLSVFKAHILICVPLSPIKAIIWESAENDECLYLDGIYCGKCFIGWCECNGEYSMFIFYYKTAKNLPSGLYSMWIIGF